MISARLSRQIVAALTGFLLIGGALGSLTEARSAALSIGNVRVSNVTDQSFTVTWTTDAAESGGFIMLGTDPNGLVTRVNESPGLRDDVHWVQVDAGLAPSTTYAFDVWTGSQVDNRGGAHYQVTLGPPLGQYLLPITIRGQALQPDGQTPAAGALVRLTVTDTTGLNPGPASTTSAPLSALTAADGGWSVLLAPRTEDGSAIFRYATNGADSVTYAVDAPGLGSVPSARAQLVMNASGQYSVGTIVLVPAGLSTVTPTTPTFTATATATASATPTPAPSPTAAQLPTEIATAADPTPTAPPAAPSPEPSATRPPPSDEDPLQALAVSVASPALPPRTAAMPRPLATASVGRQANSPSSQPPLPATPGRVAAAVAAEARGTPAPRATSRRATPAAPTLTPTPSGGLPPENQAAAPSPSSELDRVTILLRVAGGVIGVGVILALAGAVDQARRG